MAAARASSPPAENADSVRVEVLGHGPSSHDADGLPHIRYRGTGVGLDLIQSRAAAGRTDRHVVIANLLVVTGPEAQARGRVVPQPAVQALTDARTGGHWRYTGTTKSMARWLETSADGGDTSRRSGEAPGKPVEYQSLSDD